MKLLRSSCLLAALLLCGCVLSPVEPDVFATYRLELGSGAVKGDEVAWQLAIEHPIASGPIAGAQIAVHDSDGAYSVLRGARWSERAPDLVQSALLRSFEDSGRIRGVVRSESGVRADYYLLVELRAFEADYTRGDPPEATVVLHAKLVRTVGMDVVDAHLFSEREPAKGGDAAAIVAAFDRAAARAIPAVRDWALKTGQGDWTKPH
jgi:cholesterol transport system auxiliary component